MLTATTGLHRAMAGTGQRAETAACISRPLKAVKSLLELPGRARDAVTSPIAGKMVGYWCSGNRYEKACLHQAYQFADRAIGSASELVKKGSAAAGMEPGEWERIENLASLMEATRGGIDVLGSCAGGLGAGLKWIGSQMGNASNALFERGQTLGQSQSLMGKTAGKALSGASYLPWLVSYAPSSIGYVLEKGGQKTQAAMQAIHLRKRVAEEVFLPLILQGNFMIKKRLVQGCLNVCANTSYLYAVGVFDMASWARLGSSAVSAGSKAVFAAQASVGGWIWAPTVKSGADLLRATCQRKAQIEQLKTALLNANPSLRDRWNYIPGGAEFLLGLFLESHSFLLSYYTNSPEAFVQAFCDWSNVFVEAGSIAMRFAGERN